MINPEDEISGTVYRSFAVFAAGLAGGKFVSPEGVLGAKVARADAIRAAEHLWGFFGGQGRDFAAMLQSLVCFAERHADIVFGDKFSMMRRDALPGGFGSVAGFPDQAAALV